MEKHIYVKWPLHIFNYSMQILFIHLDKIQTFSLKEEGELTILGDLIYAEFIAFNA